MSGLVIYAVYENPSDYPGKFVIRSWAGWHGNPIPSSKALVFDTYDEVIAALKPDLVRIARMPHDDPALRETWL